MGTVATTNISIRMDTELKKQAESAHIYPGGGG